MRLLGFLSDLAKGLVQFETQQISQELAVKAGFRFKRIRLRRATPAPARSTNPPASCTPVSSCIVRKLCRNLVRSLS